MEASSANSATTRSREFAAAFTCPGASRGIYTCFCFRAARWPLRSIQNLVSADEWLG